MKSKYGHKFLNWIEKFINKHKLFDSSKTLTIACSAGVDSICLAECLLELYISRRITLKAVELLYIDHRQRESKHHTLDKKIVKKLASKYGVNFVSHSVSSRRSGNLENFFRQERLKIFRKYDQVALGHHLDDSFEWHLMQSFKSSNLKNSIGIPFRNNNVYRPFMCVSKRQILKLAQVEKYKFHEDITNEDTNFERAYLRKNIIQAISKVYPNYLEHYVKKANQLYSNSSRSNDFLIKEVSNLKAKLLFNSKLNNNFEAAKGLIRDIIFELSDKKRGSVERQIDKLINAMKSNKSGPMVFSGNVNAYLYNSAILFTKNKLNLNFNFSKKKISLDEFTLSFKKIVEQETLTFPNDFYLKVYKTNNTSRFESTFSFINKLERKNFSKQKILCVSFAL